MNQDPAERIRVPQDESEPRRTYQGPAKLIRVPCDGPGSSRTKQGPHAAYLYFYFFASEFGSLQKKKKKIVRQIRGVFSFGLPQVYQVGPTQKKILQPPLVGVKAAWSTPTPTPTRGLLPRLASSVCATRSTTPHRRGYDVTT